MDMEVMLMQLADTAKNLITNNWSFFVGVVFAVFAVKILKTGLEIAGSVLVIAGGICLLTNFGVLPPLDELMALAKEGAENLLPMIKDLIGSFFAAGGGT